MEQETRLDRELRTVDRAGTPELKTQRWAGIDPARLV